ncbi:MAG: TraB/GumN family protein [Muribaculaceae bacterium]|nr:TraB/GumN family protein [Muribaculaceae bacterium]
MTYLKYLALALIFLTSCHLCRSQVLYEISGNGLEQPSYIFGTHHLAPKSMLDSIPHLKEIMESRETLIGELDLTGSQFDLVNSMQKYMLAPADSTLSRLYSPMEMDRLNEKFTALAPIPGINLYALDNMRPMAVNNLISVAVFQRTMPDYDPEFQIDRYLQEVAVSTGQSVLPLETPEEQARLLFTFQPLTVQAESLAEMLDNPDKVTHFTEQLNSAYLQRDLQTLQEISRQESTEREFVDALIDNRNRRWAPVIIKTIKNKPALIVCGALHLPGDNGLLNLLTQEGYTITPIY